MNPFEMVVIIVAISAVAGMYKMKYAARRGGHERDSVAADIENQRLREEVTALKDRLAVLERITIEKENSLEREIEKLRDK